MKEVVKKKTELESYFVNKNVNFSNLFKRSQFRKEWRDEE